MVGLAKRRSIDAPGWRQTSVSPLRGNTSGSMPSGRSIRMHPQRLCTWLFHYGHRVLSEIIFLTLGPPMLPPHAVHSRTAFSPHVLILGLLLGLTQTGNTGGATLNTCCLNAQIPWAREAHWRLSFPRMTCLGRVLDLIMPRRCCLQRFLLIVPCCGCHGLSCLVPPRLCGCTAGFKGSAALALLQSQLRSQRQNSRPRRSHGLYHQKVSTFTS